MGNDPKQGEDFVKSALPNEFGRSRPTRQGIDPKQGEDFVKSALPKELGDDVEGHKAGIDPKQGEDFLKEPY